MFPPPPYLSFHLVVHGPGDAAKRAWRQIRGAVGPLVKLAAPRVGPSLKIEGCQEVWAVAPLPAASAAAIYDDVLGRLAPRWGSRNDSAGARWAVWNPWDGSFAAPAVRWASVQLTSA